MKTLREILLEKHEPALPRLNEVRRRAVRAAVEAGESAHRAPILVLIWREFIRPSRGWWSALAGAWMAILTLHLLCLGSDEARPSASSAPLSAAELSILKEQSQWMAELSELDPLWTEPKKPGPRGDRAHGSKSA
jgi:hypothetical protein